MNAYDDFKKMITGARIHKVRHYFEAYAFHLNSFIDKPVNLLEIGIGQGGSLKMWKNYFKNGTVYGLDYRLECKEYEEDQIHVFIGDQADTEFLENIVKDVCFDIVIDDGGHRMIEQLTSFNVLFPSLNNGGVYIAEDLCTSYWPTWGGGFRREDTFVEFLKSLVDKMNMWSARHENARECKIDVPVDRLEETISSVHVYNGIGFIHKRGHAFHSQHGENVSGG